MSNLIILGGGLPRSRSLGRGLHDRLGPPSANDPLAGQRDEAANQHPIDLSPAGTSKEIFAAMQSPLVDPQALAEMLSA